MNTQTKKQLATDFFTQTITNYLRERCKNDTDFCQRCKDPNKSIEKCIEYIFYSVKQDGKVGYADNEIFSLAVHYFDEPEITFEKVEKPLVVNNYHIDLTEQEKAIARQQAIENYQKQVIADMQKPKIKPQNTTENFCYSLF